MKNLLGLKSKKEIDDAEVAAYARAFQFTMHNFAADQQLSMADIDAIHQAFFGSIYSWAGRHRVVNLSKEGFTFPAARFLTQSLETFEETILKPNTPCSGTQEEVLAKTALVHLELLFIHPFREGNGRTARLVATLMAVQAGYNGFDWSVIEKRFDEYVSAIQKLNLVLMRDLLRNALLA
ncbi:cell filamentation protein Fic [Chlorobium sp. BLA1]|uniref:Fic/DOC family protein n=1 Tax=Candidatus Chlorobium masyuteum TaxID=2716876 RepID=UPI0014224561|nr:Fic family protein [Candidatus Chlorobium masyuteum]NHQ59663.1 cell filamentation protein Fic [Candidatus Chlorobium masyuteum]